MVERFGHLAPIRENLLARDDMPMTTRQALLASFRRRSPDMWPRGIGSGRSMPNMSTKEACEKATVALAADTPYDEVGELVQHLRESGQLTAGMILRALLSGNVVLFEEALAELSGLPLDRVASYIHDKNISGFRALYRKAGLPDVAYPAFREALAAMREGLATGGHGGAARLRRRFGRARARRLRRASGARHRTLLLALLRRFAVEAAREEARMFLRRSRGRRAGGSASAAAGRDAYGGVAPIVVIRATRMTRQSRSLSI